MTRSPRAARTAATLVGLLVVTALAGCTDPGPDPADTAAELAAALQAGELPASLFADGSPQQEYDEVVAGLGEVDPEVVVEGVTTDDDARSDGSAGLATATLAWSWDLGAATWSYRSQARLTEADGDGDGQAEGAEGWLVTWSPDLVEPSLRADEALAADRVAADRGRILGADGAVLVRERPVVRVGLDKTRLRRSQLAASARRVAAAAGIAPGPYVGLVRDAGAEAFVEAIVLRRPEAGRVTGGLAAIPGAVALVDTLPLAPTREFAAPVLGRVGEVTAEIVEQSEGRLQAGDVAGLSGLQSRYDEQLSGTPGVEVTADGDGEPRELFSVAPEPGQPLRTTLDPRLQARAEAALAVPDAERPGPATALVAVRPSDGAVLAAANGPGTDGLNAATYGQYAPGSTFKVISALALLRAGLDPTSEVDCPPAFTVDGKRFENYDDYPPDRLGSITLREALASSCNTAFIQAGDELGRGALADAAASLGLGVDHDLGFPAYFGQVPPPRSATEAAADLIGQGRVLASPLTMAAVAASVQAGRTVVPHLLVDTRPEARPEAPLTSGETDALRSMMRAVVTEGSGAVLAPLPGAVGAKTGTAEYGEPGPDGGLRTHGWMIAFQGDLAVAAFVEDGASGSSAAGPLLRAFLSN